MRGIHSHVILLLIACCYLLTACGGGSSIARQAESIRATQQAGGTVVTTSAGETSSPVPTIPAFSEAGLDTAAIEDRQAMLKRAAALAKEFEFFDKPPDLQQLDIQASAERRWDDLKGYAGALAQLAKEATNGAIVITVGTPQPGDSGTAPGGPISDVAPGQVARGGYVCPVNAPGRVRMTQGNGVGSHVGWSAVDLAVDGDGDGNADIPGSDRAPLVAVKDGVISRIVEPSGNIAVYLRTADGEEFLYSHLAGYPDSPDGVPVAAGQLIGFMGSTGNSSGNHLDFHWVINGVAQSDYSAILNACGT